MPHDLFAEDGVGILQDGDFFGRDLAHDAHAEAGAGEGLALDKFARQAELTAEGADLVRRGLRIAAADADGSVRIELLRAADGVAGFLVGDGGDGAGVDNIAVARLVEFTERMTMGQQHLLHCLRFVLVDLAPKGIKREFHR